MLAKDQPVLELETDKATIEVPSSVSGQVKEIKVKVGDKVKVGQAILSVDGGNGAAPKAAAEPASAPEPAAAQEKPTDLQPSPEPQGPPAASAKPSNTDEEDTRPVVVPP